MSRFSRLGSKSLFERPRENSTEPKRIVVLSTEGTNTEKQYFTFIEKYKKEIRIDENVHIIVLKRVDTKSDLEHVFKLLEEYIQIREGNQFEEILQSLNLKSFSTELVYSYLENPSKISSKECKALQAALQEDLIPLKYLYFLSTYKGEDDKFGIVVDRDCGSHSVEQMENIIQKCERKDYLCYITNPCFEFWLLLHISDVASEYSAHLDKILANELDEKKNSFVSNLLHEKTGQRKAIQDKDFRKYYLPHIDQAIKRAKSFAPSDQLLKQIGTNLWELIELLREKPPH